MELPLFHWFALLKSVPAARGEMLLLTPAKDYPLKAVFHAKTSEWWPMDTMALHLIN
jgi:hypothetical protein